MLPPGPLFPLIHNTLCMLKHKCPTKCSSVNDFCLFCRLQAACGAPAMLPPGPLSPLQHTPHAEAQTALNVERKWALTFPDFFAACRPLAGHQRRCRLDRCPHATHAMHHLNVSLTNVSPKVHQVLVHVEAQPPTDIRQMSLKHRCFCLQEDCEASATPPHGLLCPLQHMQRTMV